MMRRWATAVAGGVPGRFWAVALVMYLLAYWFTHENLKMWFGDSLYYTSMTMMSAGHPYADAIDLTGAYFNDPDIWRLDRGYSNPAFYDLIKPRVVYVWLSTPFVWLMGPSGMYVVPAICGVITIVLLLRFFARFFSPTLATALVVLLMTTNQFWFYSTGIYTETLCVLFIAVLMYQLPFRGPVARANLVGITAVIVLLTFTRQMTVVPVAMVLGGWLWSAIRHRRIRTEWFAPALTALLTGLAAQVTMMVIAPFDALRQFVVNTGYSGNPRGAVLNLPNLAWETLVAEIWSYRVNVSGLLLWAAALAAGFLLWRSEAAGVYFGGLLSSFAFDLLNGTMTAQRYLYPIVPACLFMVGLAVHRMGRSRTPEPDAGPAAAAGSGDRQLAEVAA
ncbi:hypothetical protein [Catellatospora paridis]|uniref:hypothetical protein n=1 Tax=Catellatospora paridis TaxID=1617086 RepID=UPI0012D3FA45|nr:hypothetical protein [Catellatospora paridis]